MKNKLNKEKIKYKAFAFCLHSGTYEKLKILKVNSGKSWNRFFYELINTYIEFKSNENKL